jgi:serine/threonine-protein kinase SRPK3
MDETLKAFLQEHPSESYGPHIEPSVSSDPIITVKSQPLPNFGLCEDLSNIQIRLIDFGVGKLVANVLGSADWGWIARTKEMCLVGADVVPFALRAPEIILGHPWFTPVDIWSVGCLVGYSLVNHIQYLTFPQNP